VGVLDGWKICPRCGTELELADRGHLACPGCGSHYWANSSPAVSGLLERNGKVLLGRRRIEPRRGYWDIPGGFLEEGEEVFDGLRREFLEETGLDVEPVDWIGAFVDPYDSNYVLGLCWVVRGDGEPIADDDVEELAWFGPDELPEEMAFATQHEALQIWATRHEKM
jgi:ADP-ribose pyrophosphatase YjhB (NUDIX family)